MAFADANGVTFHVQSLGAGPPLVLVHGLLLGSLASWYFTAAPALARRHRVLMYDLRGHGRTARTRTGFDLDTQLDDLDALLAALGVGAEEPVSLCGHSYGGLVALRFALRHPGRVRRLAVVEAPLPPSRFEELTSFVARRPDEMLDALPENVRGLLARPGRQAARLVESLAFLARETTLLRALEHEPDLSDDALAGLGAETLCVYGTRSRCLDVGERLVRVLPRASLVRLDGGHFLPSEAPVALTAALVEHFGG